MEKPGVLQLMGGRKESRHNLATEQQNTLDAMCTFISIMVTAAPPQIIKH